MGINNKQNVLLSMDSYSYQDTLIHRIDARVKVLITAVFIVSVVSFSKYALVELIPFFCFPIFAAVLAEIPATFILKRILLVSPFIIFVGIFNPVFDRELMQVTLGLEIAAGWISFISILLKSVLTISAALLLIASTSFPGVCQALRRLGFPKAFTSQLLFLYRYLFLMTAEAGRMSRARDLRSFGSKGRGIRILSSLLGVLLVRTLEKAERIYCAMQARAYSGEVLILKKLRLRMIDGIIFVIALGLVLFFRYFPLAEYLGIFLTGN